MQGVYGVDHANTNLQKRMRQFTHSIGYACVADVQDCAGKVQGTLCAWKEGCSCVEVHLSALKRS